MGGLGRLKHGQSTREQKSMTAPADPSTVFPARPAGWGRWEAAERQALQFRRDQQREATGTSGDERSFRGPARALPSRSASRPARRAAARAEPFQREGRPGTVLQQVLEMPPIRLRRGEAPRLSRVRAPLLWVCPRAVHDVPHGIRRGILLQGPRRLPVLQRPPHGPDGRPPCRSRHPAGARAAVGDLGAEAAEGLSRRPTPSRRSPHEDLSR